jgi:hypothetical protein
MKPITVVPAARTAAAIAAAALLLLASACSGSTPSSTGHAGSGNTGGSSLVAFSGCMRSHGVRDFPDPQPGATNEKFPSAQQLGVGSSQLSAAENACQHLLPAGVGDRFLPAEVPVLLSGMRQFSQCMRSHGLPDWPDPTTDSQGRPEFPLSAVPGHDRNYWRSPQVMTIVGECQHLMPSALGGVPVG